MFSWCPSPPCCFLSLRLDAWACSPQVPQMIYSVWWWDWCRGVLPSPGVGGGRACFDSCLSLRDSAQPSVLSWQLDSDEMSQLKRGGGRLRVIPVQRSSLTRNDSGTEVVDEWDRKPIIIWRQKEKHAAMLANSVYTVLYYVKGSRFHVIWWRALNVCLQLLYIMRSKTNN